MVNWIGEEKIVFLHSKRNVEILKKKKGLTKSVEELILLDVHSGLGPPGQDTLMVDENTALVRQVFDCKNKVYIRWFFFVIYKFFEQKAHSFGANHLTPPLIEDESVKGGANDGYELTKGFFQSNWIFKFIFEIECCFWFEKGDTKDPEEGYPSLFSNLDRKKSMTVTQEVYYFQKQIEILWI